MVRGLRCPQNASRSQNFKIFTFLRGYCGQTVRPGASAVALFCTTMGPLLIAYTHFGVTPNILPPGALGRATPKKVFPHFLKNLRGRGQFFDCAIRGPPRPVRDKILATVPRPTFPEKNSEISHKIDFLSSYKNFPLAKKFKAMRTDALYKWAKVQPDRFNFRSFKAKKPCFSSQANAFQGKTKNGVGNTNSSTLCVIGVGSPDGEPGRGDRQGPPDAVPGRLRPPTDASGRPVDIVGSGAPETSGGGQGMATAGRGRKAKRSGRSAP